MLEDDEAIYLNGNGHIETNGNSPVLDALPIFTQLYLTPSEEFEANLVYIGRVTYLLGHLNVPGGIHIQGKQGNETQVTEWYGKPIGNFDLAERKHEETGNRYLLVTRNGSHQTE